MEWGRTDQVARDAFRLTRTHPNHLQGKREAPALQQAGSFREQLFGTLDSVNDSQREHRQLAVQAIVDPDSVDAHDVTVAAAKADQSLRITKNVVDQVIRAYREITGVR